MKIIKILLMIIFIISVVANRIFADVNLPTKISEQLGEGIKKEDMFYYGTKSKKGYLDDITEYFSQTKPKSNRDFVINYCHGVLSNTLFDMKIDESFYSARNSLFVFFMCSNIHPDYKNFFGNIYNDTYSYVNYYKFDDLGVGNCNTMTYMNDCKLEEISSNIIDKIINEYFNIKQAVIYGSFTNEINEAKGDLESIQINNFVKDLFYGVVLYDKKGDLGGSKQYPKTYNKVKKYFHKSQKLLNRLILINNKAIYNEYKIIKKDSTKSCEYLDVNKNIIMCGLFYPSSFMKQFVNLLYNELFYYKLFVDNYIIFLKNNPRVVSRNYDKSAQKIQDKIEYLKQRYIYTKKAIDYSIDMLSELYISYPLHIGFLMYYEDLVNLRKELVKLVTPLYSLYDVLRNVQEQK